MRNLKKILALALVFAMAFTFTASAADFTDAAEIGANYVDDVNMLVELGVIAGYPDGSFGPQKNITRAEFAKMAYTIKYGSDTDGNLFAAQKSNFWDVEGNANVAWAKGYINYCANQNIVSGVGGGKFNPQGNITVAEATKMLLVILGCDPAKEGFTGANWVANVTAKAIDLGIYNGWTGDPSILATRELVAKLMRNTIFSSVYTYSAITGSGSQMDALGQNYNQTLGEQTMGLRAVTGIVVANERYELVTDEFGDALEGTMPNHRDDESVVYYTRKNSNGTTTGDYVVLDRVLDDDMLGAKVNVYFTADIIKNSNGDFLRYEDLKVLGNVLVHSDTVAYTVPAIATKVMPDASSNSGSTIRPYIAFEVDGVEKQVVASKDMPKVAKKVNAQTDTNSANYIDYDIDGDGTVDSNVAVADAMKAEFARNAYVVNGAGVNEDGTLEYAGTATNLSGNIAASFMADFGLPTLSQYRFVSVDGGETYSYIFKMVNGNSSNNINTNATWGSVTAYNAERGTIKLSNCSAMDLDEVVLVDEVAVDDYVVYYRANGKVYIEKAESFVATVEDFTDDGAVVLNGNAYFALYGGDIIAPNENLYTHFYQAEIGALNRSAEYLTFGNIIMKIELDDVEVAEDSNFGVILRSWYDDEEDFGYVTIAQANGSEGTYQIGKLYTRRASEPESEINDRPEDFAGNAYFGMIVRYKIREDGTIDLSEQYFKDNDYRSTYVDGTTVDGTYVDGAFVPSGDTKTEEINFTEDKFIYTKSINGVPQTSASYYTMSDSTIIFALYGSPCYRSDGTVDVDPSETKVGELPLEDSNVNYMPVKARVYKVDQVKDLPMDKISNLYVTLGGNGQIAENGVGHLMLNSKTATQKLVVAASITVGESTSGIKYNQTGSFAYVAAAKGFVNPATKGYYANLTLINEEGVFTARTVDNVEDYNGNRILDEEAVGSIDGERGTFPAGTFIRYNMDADGKITVVDKFGGEYSDIKKTYDSSVHTGLFLVNLIGRKGDVVTFYDTDAQVNTKNDQAMSAKFHKEDGCKIISITGDEYDGEALSFIPANQELIELTEGGNAIIEVSEHQIVRIFSFTEGYAFADYVD